MHMAALQTAGKKQQLQSAKGQLTSAKGKYEGAAAQLAYSKCAVRSTAWSPTVRLTPVKRLLLEFLC